MSSSTQSSKYSLSLRPLTKRSSVPRLAPIVVGVDGSGRALDACAWAARQAWSGWAPLRLVHATMDLTRGRQSHARQVLDEAVQRVRKAAPGLAARALVVTGYPDDVLASQCAEASMVVIGFRHGGLLRRLVHNPTATANRARAGCPVAVIPSTAVQRPELAPVILEVTGAEQLPDAFEVAADLAMHSGQPLSAVQVTPGPVDTQHLLLLHEVIKPWQAKYPQLAINPSIKVGRPADVLAAMSAFATAVVVCARQVNHLSHAHEPSLSQALLRRAHCPVIVIPS